MKINKINLEVLYPSIHVIVPGIAGIQQMTKKNKSWCWYGKGGWN